MLFRTEGCVSRGSIYEFSYSFRSNEPSPFTTHLQRDYEFSYGFKSHEPFPFTTHLQRDDVVFAGKIYKCLEAYSHNGILKAGERYSVSRTFQYILWFIF